MLHSNEHKKHCPILTNREAHTAVVVVREMALIIDHVLPNAANDTRTSRSFDDLWRAFLCVCEVFVDRLFCSLLAPTKFSSLSKS